MAREYPKGKRDTWAAGTTGWDSKHASDSREGYSKARQFAEGGKMPMNQTKSPFTTENQGSREYPKAERKVAQKSELTQWFKRGGMVQKFEEGGEAGGDEGGNPRDGNTPGGYAGGGYNGASPGDPGGYQGGNPADQAQGLGNMGASEAYGGQQGYQGNPADREQGLGNMGASEAYGGQGDYTGGGYVGGGNPADRDQGVFSGGASNVDGPGPDATGDPMGNGGFRASGSFDNPEPDWHTFNQDHMPRNTVKDQFGNDVDPTTMRNAVYNAANRHGLDPQTMFDVTNMESAFQPTARHGSFRGIAQIGPAFAADMGVKNPNDYQESLDAAASAMSTKNQRLNALGINPTEGDTYMTHQQGMTGAKSMMRADPDDLAKEVTSRENIASNMPPGAKAKGLTPDNITAEQFRSEWDNAIKTIQK